MWKGKEKRCYTNEPNACKLYIFCVHSFLIFLTSVYSTHDAFNERKKRETNEKEKQQQRCKLYESASVREQAKKNLITTNKTQ